MHTYILIIAYDGTDFHGWQVQHHCIAVANVLEQTFEAVFGQHVAFVGASRTDAGVHALGQVARIQTTIDICPRVMQRVLNGRLPKSILIRNVQKAVQPFHPQHNVLEKTYYYYLSTNRPLPFIARYVYHYRLPFNTSILGKSLQKFVGTHDFRSFCTGYDKESTIRTVNSIELDYFKRFGVYRIGVHGSSFLYYMIRRIVGGALHVATYDKYCPESIVQAIQEKNPAQPFPTAPAHGLVLYKIRYDHSIGNVPLGGEK